MKKSLPLFAVLSLLVFAGCSHKNSQVSQASSLKTLYTNPTGSDAPEWTWNLQGVLTKMTDKTGIQYDHDVESEDSTADVFSLDTNNIRILESRLTEKTCGEVVHYFKTMNPYNVHKIHLEKYQIVKYEKKGGNAYKIYLHAACFGFRNINTD